MITCQHEWIEQCQIKYRYESLPEGEHWEDAHYPIPECQGGIETVRLWSRDHAVHGFLQSEDLDQVCFHGYRRKTDRALIETYYPEYLELCDRWFIEGQRRAFQVKMKKNPNCQSEAGMVQGRINVESGHLDRIRLMRDPAGVVERARRQGQINVESGHWGSLKTPEHQRYAASRSHEVHPDLVSRTLAKNWRQKWEDPDHPELGVTTSGALAMKQKARGLPHGKENRRRVG
jgi:hypothetical protein